MIAPAASCCCDRGLLRCLRVCWWSLIPLAMNKPCFAGEVGRGRGRDAPPDVYCRSPCTAHCYTPAAPARFAGPVAQSSGKAIVAAGQASLDVVAELVAQGQLVDAAEVARAIPRSDRTEHTDTVRPHALARMPTVLGGAPLTLAPALAMRRRCFPLLSRTWFPRPLSNSFAAGRLRL